MSQMVLSFICIVLAVAASSGSAEAQQHWPEYVKPIHGSPLDSDHPYLTGKIEERPNIDDLVVSSLALLRNFGSTVTSTSTSVITTTCTKSTTACAGRRRRSLVRDLMEDDVQPSAVHPVETTQAAALPSYKREGREADPMYYYQQPHYNPSFYGNQQYYQHPYGLQPSSGINYEPSYSQYHLGSDLPYERIGIIASLLNSLVRPTTTTTTVFSVSTVTSTPGCSVAGPLAQCPASG